MCTRPNSDTCKCVCNVLFLLVIAFKPSTGWMFRASHPEKLRTLPSIRISRHIRVTKRYDPQSKFGAREDKYTMSLQNNKCIMFTLPDASALFVTMPKGHIVFCITRYATA